MKRTGLFLISALLLAGTLNAGVKELNISVWPEYDHPGVLIIMNGEFSEDTEFPVNLTFSLPENVHTVLTMGSSEKADSTVNFKAAGTEITIPFLHQMFQVEYYNQAVSDDAARQFSVKIDPKFAITEQVTLYAQEPLSAKNFKLNYEYDSVETDRHGMKYYKKALGPMAAGDVFNAVIKYENADMKMSIEKLREMMGMGGEAPAAAAEPEMINPGKNHIVWWIIGGFAVAAIIVLVLMRRDEQKPAEVSDVKKSKKQVGGKKYCTSCGGEINSDHKFCPWCGKHV